MKINKLHILAIATHPDDIELGCAGTLIKHVMLGQRVGIIDLTEGELSTRGTVETRRKEALNASQAMGIIARMNAGLSDGFFNNDKEHQLNLIPYIRFFQPDIVIANALTDRHPDHRRGGRLIADACFLAGLRKIETEWEGEKQEAWRPKRIYHMLQDKFVEPTFIVDITATQQQKMEAIACYKSQFYNEKSDEPVTYIASNDFLNKIIYRDGLMGKRIGVKFGEGFVCENVPGVANLDELILPELP